MNKDEIKFFLKKICIFFLFSFLIVLIINNLYKRILEKKEKLDNEQIRIFFLKKFDSSKLIELRNKINNDGYSKELESYFKVFKTGFNKKKKFVVKNIDSNVPVEDKQKIKFILDKIFQQKEFYFYFVNYESDINSNILEIKNFFNIKAGSNLDFLKRKYFQSTNSIKIGILDNFQFKELNNLEIFSNEEIEEKISLENYNFLIREKVKDKKINNFVLKITPNQKEPFLKVFVDDSGDLPIQWPSKLKWNYLFFWGYIWNVLILFVGSLLYFFSNIFSYKIAGFFFGNLGLGIILTTIIIRTLLWPIYTKTSSFALNMSLSQPEIKKIQEKYYLKKDPESRKKMQLEILKVYQKHNFSIFDIFISFLQMPIFIAMLRTLNRIRVEGGIFQVYTEKPFLNFIYLGKISYPKNYFFTQIFLSCLVGLTIFYLNKMNFNQQKNSKTKTNFLTLENKNKEKNQEKNAKIINYIMIILMMLTSYKDSCLSLYWIIGNIYTIFQTIINRKIMNKNIIYNRNKKNIF
jgi:YidC/Oxa1 family membrane protein insertase